VHIGKDLQFDVPGLREIFFEQDRIVTKPGFRSRRADASAAANSSWRRTMRMPLPSPAGRCLDQHRKSYRLGFARKERIRLIIAVIPGHQRHAPRGP